MKQKITPRKGRPRSEASRSAILDEALRQCKKIGYTNMTVDLLAREAGVGKPTIYRWWSSLEEILFEALCSRATGRIQKAKVKSAKRFRLEEFFEITFAEAKKIRSVLCQMMGVSQLDPNLRKDFFKHFIEVRQTACKAALERELHVDDKNELGLLVDIAFGFMWYRLLLGHAPLGAEESLKIGRILRFGAKSVRK